MHTYTHARIILCSTTTRRRTVITQKLTPRGVAARVRGPRKPTGVCRRSRRTARGRVTNGVLRKSRVRRHTRKRRRRCTLNGAKRFKYNFVRRQREKTTTTTVS